MLGGARQPARLPRPDGMACQFQPLAQFHLDERQTAPSHRDQVDLASRRSNAPCQDAIALRQQKRCGHPFGKSSRPLVATALVGGPLLWGASVLGAGR